MLKDKIEEVLRDLHPAECFDDMEMEAAEQEITQALTRIMEAVEKCVVTKTLVVSINSALAKAEVLTRSFEGTGITEKSLSNDLIIIKHCIAEIRERIGA